MEDQPPEFITMTPVARISENARIGTSVLQGQAFHLIEIIIHEEIKNIKKTSRNYFLSGKDILIGKKKVSTVKPR